MNHDSWRETHVSGQSSLLPKPRAAAILFVLGPAPKPALISARLTQTMDARRRLVLQRHAVAISFDRRAACYVFRDGRLENLCLCAV